MFCLDPVCLSHSVGENTIQQFMRRLLPSKHCSINLLSNKRKMNLCLVRLKSRLGLYRLACDWSTECTSVCRGRGQVKAALMPSFASPPTYSFSSSSTYPPSNANTVSEGIVFADLEANLLPTLPAAIKTYFTWDGWVQWLLFDPPPAS